MHTGPTCNPRGCAYRLRDITDWQTHQGAGASIPQSTAVQSDAEAILIGGQGTVDTAEQIAHALAGVVGFLIQALLLVQ